MLHLLFLVVATSALVSAKPNGLARTPHVPQTTPAPTPTAHRHPLTLDPNPAPIVAPWP